MRRLRRDRDLSQEALAEMASIHRNHLGAIERGTKTPSLTAILHLADALGVTPAQLLDVFQPGAGRPAD